MKWIALFVLAALYGVCYLAAKAEGDLYTEGYRDGYLLANLAKERRDA